jgi:hypothetical protein
MSILFLCSLKNIFCCLLFVFVFPSRHDFFFKINYRIFGACLKFNRIRWGPCHHVVALKEEMAADISNKQSHTTDKGWSSSLEVGSGG